MKPKWMNASPDDTNAKDTLRKAAKVLREDARQMRASPGSAYDRKQARFIAGEIIGVAYRLEKVANGATWADAFDLGDE